MGQKTPENSSRASSPSCSDCENFPMVPTLETSYLARAAKNEFLNLVPDIEEMRPGSSRNDVDRFKFLSLDDFSWKQTNSASSSDNSIQFNSILFI
uniref:kinesin-like protein KIF1B n=1 Tax=Maylandia zebra TaxID=106582 RepID=UPI000D2FB95C|nr:kinesin-like protein KIF1B [Maylandia zebra]XP_024657575.1 kinesin-like protein KIF1B [Maylandia zebra]